MENKYCSFVEKKLTDVKFVSLSVNDAQYKRSNTIGQIAFKFPKVGKTIIYVSLLTAELFMLTSNNGRISQTLKLSKDLKEISEAAIKAFEMACVADKLDKKIVEKNMLKVC